MALLQPCAPPRATTFSGKRSPTQSLERVDTRDPRKLKLMANGQNGEVLMEGAK